MVDIPTLGTLFFRFGMSLFLGFLIGLEREREKDMVFAGMRTFALVALLGALMAFASDQFIGAWLFIAGFMTVAGYGLLSYFRAFESGHTGITTEVVFMTAFMLGALVYWDLLPLAAAITVAVVVVLTFKPNLQRFLENVDRGDIIAGLEFAIVWVIVLPLLPNATYGPLDVLNPHEIWLFVVLVAGINLASYILAQVYGAARGIGVAGMLGGMISSTAVTLDFARRSSKEEQHFDHLFALAISVASTGMFIRVIVLTLVINFSLGMAVAIPMLVGAVVMGVGIGIMALRIRRTDWEDEDAPEPSESPNPFALAPAIRFGLLFAAILIISKAAETYLGEAGTYISSIVGSLAGLDAVTLSIAKLSTISLPQTTAVRSLAFAATSNMVFKGGLAAALGSGAVRRQVLPLFLIAGAATLAASFLAVI